VESGRASGEQWITPETSCLVMKPACVFHVKWSVLLVEGWFWLSLLAFSGPSTLSCPLEHFYHSISATFRLFELWLSGSGCLLKKLGTGIGTRTGQIGSQFLDTKTGTSDSASDSRLLAVPNIKVLAPNKLNFLFAWNGRGVWCFPTFILYLYTNKKANLLICIFLS